MRNPSAIGVASFPRGPHDLRSTHQCPACFTALRATTCHACGLDLAHPLAADLARLSTSIADDLDARIALIDRMRREPVTSVETLPATAATVPAASAAPVASVTPGSAPPPSTPTPIVADAPAPAPAPAEVPTPTVPSAQASAPRRSGVQVALIVVGIALLSVFALFAVVFAFIAFGVVVRSLLIGAATVATILAATVLSRRGLTATAEGLAALGTVVLVLDAYAVRRSDVGGVGATPELGYWGVALLVIAAIGIAWARAGSHRSPLLAAVILAPLGAGLLAAEVAHTLPDGGATAGALAASAVAVALGAAITRLVSSSTTPALRDTALVSTLVALPLAGAAVVVSADALARELWPWAVAAAVAYAVLSAGAATVAARHLRGSLAGAVAAALAAVGTLVMLVVFAIAAGATFVEGAPLAAVVIAPAIVAVASDLATRRAGESAARIPLAATAITAGGVGALGTLAVFSIVVEPLVTAATAGLSSVRSSIVGDVLGVGSIVPIAVGVLAAGAGIVAAGWLLGGILRTPARLLALAPVSGVLLVLLVALSPNWLTLMVALGVLAVGSAAGVVAVVRRGRRTPETHAALIALSVIAPTSAVLALASSWAVVNGWVIGILIALAALALGRAATGDPAARSVAMGVSGLLVLVAAAALAEPLDVEAAALVLLSAAAVIAVSCAPGLLGAERLTALLTPLPFVAALAIELSDGTATHAVADSIALAALVGALVLVARPASAHRWGRVVALVALGPAAALFAARTMVASLALADDASVFPVSEIERGLVALSALALVAAVAAARATPRDRLPVDAGVTVAGLVALTAVASTAGATTLVPSALALLIAAVIAFATAMSRDGLIGSASPRRFIGWLALAFATLSLWTLLIDQEVAEPEPYVLPLAAALGVIAVLLGRRRALAATPDTVRVSVPALLAGVAVAVAGTPLGAVAGSGDALRGTVVGVFATALVLVALLAPVGDTAAWAGLRGALLVSGVAVQLTLSASVVGDVASRGPGAAPPLTQLSAALVVVMLVGTAAATWASASRDEHGHVTGPLTRGVAAATAGSAALAAASLGLAETIRPLELVTVPLALGLLLIGTLELDRRASAGSMTWLNPGLIALLVPSLIAIGDDNNLVRVVGVGLVATAVLIGGAIRRLRAPFLVGGAVLLTHIVIQSWPLLRLVGESVEWWLWLGIAGVAVVAVAARYEQRLRDLRATVNRIRDLR